MSGSGLCLQFFLKKISSRHSTHWHGTNPSKHTVHIKSGIRQGCCLLFVGCLTTQQRTSVSQGRICSDRFPCCHTEIEVADPTFYLTQSQYTDTGPTSPSADPITPGALQDSHWSANFEVTGMTRPQKIPSQAGFEPGVFRSRGGRLIHEANEAVSGRVAGRTPICMSLV